MYNHKRKPCCQPKQYTGHRLWVTKGRYKKQGLKQKLTSTPSKLHNTRYAGYKREVYLRNQTSPGTTPFNILSVRVVELLGLERMEVDG